MNPFHSARTARHSSRVAPLPLGRSFILLAAIFAHGLVAPFSTWADAADSPKPERNVHVQLTAVILPEATALPLLDEFDDPAKADAALAKALAAVQQGHGELAGTLTLHVQPNNAAVAQSVQEVRYPLEFENPSMPDLESKAQVNALPKDLTAVPLRPATFETRQVGLTLDGDVQVSPDRRILTLDCSIHHVRLLRWDEFPAGLTPGGAKLNFRQPLFFDAQDGQQIIMRNGETVLAGSHLLPDQPHRMELFILKAWTNPAPPPPEEKK